MSLSHSIQAGWRVAIIGPAGPQYAHILAALWQAEAIACPINPRFPDALISELIQNHDALISPYRLSYGPECQLPWEAPELDLGIILRDLPAEQILTEILTSGSHGDPKAVQLAWRQHQYSALGSAHVLPLQPHDRWLNPLPLFHIGGLAILIRTALAGAETYFVTPDQPLAEVIAQTRPTHLSLVPTQLWRLLQSPVCLPALRQARGILLGGAALPEALLEKAWQLALPIHVSYGSTEMSSQICTTGPGASLAELHTVGRPLPWREVQLTSEGEIQVRGRTRFQGYFKHGQLEQPFDHEGWFKTGDLGQWTPEGWLRIIGRKDNRFICGGENIQPEQIERALLRLPEVIQAMVVPRDDAEYGQRPIAFVETLALEPEHLRHRLREQLPGYLIPDKILSWPAEPAPGLKISRSYLRLLAQEYAG